MHKTLYVFFSVTFILKNSNNNWSYLQIFLFHEHIREDIILREYCTLSWVNWVEPYNKNTSKHSIYM